MANAWEQAPIVKTATPQQPKAAWEDAPIVSPSTPASPNEVQPANATAMLAPQGTGQNTSSFIKKLSEAAAGMGNDFTNILLAATQRTNPIASDINGKSVRPLVGEMLETDGGVGFATPGGGWQPIDPTKHVVLRDSADGKLKVYMETEDTKENLALSAGRVASFGMMANPIEVAKPIMAAKSALAGALAAKTAPAISDFKTVGVKPTLAVATDRPLLATIENISAKIPLGGKITEARAAMQTDAGKFLTETAEGVGSISTRDSAGRVLKEGAQGFQGRFQKKSDELFSKFDKLVDPKETVQLGNTAQSIEETISKFANSPNVGKDIIPSRIRNYLADIKQSGGGLSFEQVRDLRSYVGAQIQNPGQISDVTTGMWKQLYGNLSKDLEAFATAKGPEAALTFKRANQYYAAGKGRIEGALKFLIGDASGNEQAFERLMAFGNDKGARANIQQLVTVRRSMSPEEWEDVTGVVIRQLGKPTAARGGEFSADTFSKNWNSLAPQAKGMMFDKKTRTSLDALARVTNAIKVWDKAANHSNTATHGIMGMSLFGSLVAPTETVAAIIGNVAISRVLTSPNIVDWLTQIPKMKTKSHLQHHLARLDGIANRNPEYSNEINQIKEHYAQWEKENPEMGDSRQINARR